MNKNILGWALLVTAFFSIVSCGNEENGSDVTAGYYVSNGYCYDGSNSQVDNNYCSGMYDYYAVNGYCYSPEGVRVDENYCRNNSRYLQPQPIACVGNFYSPSQRRNFVGRGNPRGPNKSQPGRSNNHNGYTQCAGNSCRDKVMYSPQGQLVRCR